MFAEFAEVAADFPYSFCLLEWKTTGDDAEDAVN